MQATHQHLLIRATVNSAPNDAEVLNNWLIRLVEAIGMKVCIDPRSVYVSEPGNEGLTGQIGLETSHASIHIWDAESPALVQMDVYSCRCFNNQMVLELLKEFDLIEAELMSIDRADGFSVFEHYKIDNSGVA